MGYRPSDPAPQLSPAQVDIVKAMKISFAAGKSKPQVMVEAMQTPGVMDMLSLESVAALVSWAENGTLP